MIEILKNVVTDILGLPSDCDAEIRTFDTHKVILVRQGKFTLPNLGYEITGLTKNKGLTFVALRYSEGIILTVLDHSLEGEDITDEDFSFFSNLGKLTIFNSSKKEFTTFEETVIDVHELISQEPCRETGNLLTYKTRVIGSEVAVRKGSNRHTFINQEANFFEDISDFYQVISENLKPDRIEHTAHIRDMEITELVETICLTEPLKLVATFISSDSEMSDLIKRALQYRKTHPPKLTASTYWEKAVAPYPQLSFYRNIDWDKVSDCLMEQSDDRESYREVATQISYSGGNGYGGHIPEIFFAMYLIISDETAQYIEQLIYKDLKNG